MCKTIRLTAVALALAAIATAQKTWAHTDPPDATATGVGISMTAFRADGVTPVLGTFGSAVTECETIIFRATVSALGSPNAAFEGDNAAGDTMTTWVIVTPDGVTHNVKPLAHLPCIGGTTDDPNSGANNGRGLCEGSPTSLNSLTVSYTVNPADVVAGKITAMTTLANAYAHLGVNDLAGVGANTPFEITVVPCATGDICTGFEVCDPAKTDGIRVGLCEAVAPLECGESDACTDRGCDPVDGCFATDTSGRCGVSDACTDRGCDPETGCFANDTSGRCGESDACTDRGCDPVDGCFANDTSGRCGVSDACTDRGCDPETGCFANDTSGRCGVSDACTDRGCDPVDGCFANDTSGRCGVSDECTDRGCDPVDGCFANDTSGRCGESDECTDRGCDPVDGCFANDTSGRCGVSDECTARGCDPTTGCFATDTSGRCGVSDECTARGCDPATGCFATDTSGRCGVSDECTARGCDPATGCFATDTSGRCVDGDPCTQDLCDPILGCSNPLHDPLPAECVEGEGCTPGFWRANANKWDASAWPESISPSDKVKDYFTIPACLDSCRVNTKKLGNNTLLQALAFRGGRGLCGAAEILLRHAVAALLNATSDCVQYPLTPEEVVEQVNEALASCHRGTMLRLGEFLDELNNAGCPLDQHGQCSHEELE
jgi:hypothetical protein